MDFSFSVLDLIGRTPLQKISLEFDGKTYQFFAKLEFFNPSGSVKDRIAKYIIESAEKRQELKPDSVIVEATSGNTGIALSMVAAVKGYRTIIVMPEHMSLERRKIITSFGADVCLTPKGEGFAGARERARQIAKNNKNAFLTRQFENPDNIECHYRTTGKEILKQMNGLRIDAFVDGVGTGGTIMGVGKRLQEVYPDCALVAVEPAESAVLSGQGKYAPHKIAGIGDGFIPELLDAKMIDWVEVIKSNEAVRMAQEMAKRLGMMVGVSSGANVLAAISVLKKIGDDKTVVTVLPDRSERYFSTDLFSKKRVSVRACEQCENPFCDFKFKLD